MSKYSVARNEMVKHQIAARGVTDLLVLNAMRKVPREQFVANELRPLAHDDTPLPIGEDQTISQPYMVAFMIDALQLVGDEKVLEIGTGCGYAAAVLAEIADSVYTIERIAPLADLAKITLAALGYGDVHVAHGDGTKGLAEFAPFDAIVVAAGGPKVPQSLKLQLATRGRLVIPVGPRVSGQSLHRITRLSENEFHEEQIANVRFVPLIGRDGWQSD